jgi:hypothetical protein
LKGDAVRLGLPIDQLGGLSVRVRPGWTQITEMPDGAGSSARFFVSATPALQIETDRGLRHRAQPASQHRR